MARVARFIQLCLVLVMVFSQGCILNLGQPPATGQGAPPADPNAPLTTPTSTIPPTGSTTATATNPAQPGALAVAITSAQPSTVAGNVTNATLPNGAVATSMKVDLLAQDGTTVLGTATPAAADANGTQAFTIAPTAALTVGQAVSAKATQTYPDPANAANPLTRTATSSPVQVTAAGTTTAAAPVTGTGTAPAGTTSAPPTISMQLAGSGASVAVKFTNMPPNSAVQTSLVLPGGTVAGQPLNADATGAGSGTVGITPPIAVGQTLKVTLTGTNGATVTGSQTSDGRGP